MLSLFLAVVLCVLCCIPSAFAAPNEKASDKAKAAQQKNAEKKEKTVDNKKTAYAIFSEDDYSLTFMRSNKEPVVGKKYKGKTISAVYSGFEDTLYPSFSEEANPAAPWYRDEEGNSVETAQLVQSVKFDDIIQPLSTAGWFTGFSNCSYIDLRNLDTSLVTDMHTMFYGAGSNVDSFEIV